MSFEIAVLGSSGMYPDVSRACSGYLFRSSDAQVALYSPDTPVAPGLVKPPGHADLFLCEATWESGDAHVAAGGHMSAGQAGAVAQEAGVASLVLTHLRPGNDPKRAIAEAQRFFTGPVDVATDGEVRVLA